MMMRGIELIQAGNIFCLTLVQLYSTCFDKLGTFILSPFQQEGLWVIHFET